MIKNIAYFILCLFLFLQCKPESKKVSIDQLNGVYQVNKDSLKNIMLGEDDNPVAKTLMDFAINSTEINFKVENDSISGMISLMGIDQKIHAALFVRNDSIFYKGDDTEVYIEPNANGFNVEIYENDVYVERISGSKSKEISKKIDKAKLINVN